MITGRIIKIDTQKVDDSIFSQVAELLDRGGVIGYPTETVYGLGGDATNEKTVRRIFELKGRGTKKQFLCLIHSRERLYPIVNRVSEKAEKLMDTFWPGALTLIFAASEKLPKCIQNRHGRIGIRISNDPICQKMTEKYPHPIVSTSANRSGQSLCRTANEIVSVFGDDLDLVLDGGVRNGHPSTVLNVTEDPPRILRKGAIPMDRIKSVIGDVVE